MEQEERIDFKELADKIGVLNTRAQATLMYEIMQHLGAGLCRSTIKYAKSRLDKINEGLPDPEEVPTHFLHRKAELFAGTEKL